jgi:hypothetical protein
MKYSIEHLGIMSRNPGELALWYQDVLGFDHLFVPPDQTAPVMTMQFLTWKRKELFSKKKDFPFFRMGRFGFFRIPKETGFTWYIDHKFPGPEPGK